MNHEKIDKSVTLGKKIANMRGPYEERTKRRVKLEMV